MKVAVCLSGEPRQYKFCKDSHFKFILNKYECDTFFATPSHEGNYTAWTGEQLEKIIVNVDDLLDTYKPIKYEILAQSYDSIGKYNIAYKYFVDSNNIFKNVYEKQIDKNYYIEHVKRRINFFSNNILNSTSS